MAASCIAAAVQRIAIEAERQRFTLRQTRCTVPITFSIMLVQASERRSSFGSPSRVTVRISSTPSRIEPETPDQSFQMKTALGCPSWRDDRLRAQQLRQLGDVGGDAPGLVASEQLAAAAPCSLLRAIPRTCAFLKSAVPFALICSL